MITFKEMSLLERIKRLWPAYRSRRDAEMREAIRYLVKHPEAPCVIGTNFIAHGYGFRGGLYPADSHIDGLYQTKFPWD